MSTKKPVSPTGPTLTRLIHGMWRLADWNISTAELLRRIHNSFDLGITTFDHADIYGDYTCEALFGEALKREPGLRQKMQIVTKCGIKLISENRPTHRMKAYDTSRDHIVQSVEQSLRHLHTDVIDVLLIHRPDPMMDADDTASGLDAVVRSGKVRFVGVSNFLPHQFDLLASRLDWPLVTNQIEFSPLNMTALADGTADQCQQRHIFPMAWSPFAGGRLFQEQSEQAHRVRTTLYEIGNELGGASIDQVALAWILAHPAHFLPILGSGNTDRIQQAVAAQSLQLTRDQWFMVWQASMGRAVP